MTGRPGAVPPDGTDGPRGTAGRRLREGVGRLIDLSASLALGDPEARDEALEGCAEAVRGGALDAVEVEEAILQSYLFLGYPTALNAFGRWRELSGVAPPAPTPDDWPGWVRRGEEVCGAVYAGQYDGLRENIRRLHPDLERWMVAEGYGKVLGRPGLELRWRELCIVAILAVQGVPIQLYSHLRGALQVGASLEEVEEALDRAIGPSAGSEAGGRAAMARSVWSRVRRRATGGSSAGE